MNVTGSCLVAAASLFWVSWLLMPGVGVTDAARIFELVGANRSHVLASVVLQLVSAALYVLALVGVAASPLASVRRAAGVLMQGALGSAADAVLHLLAYAMTAPGLDPTSLAPVMQFMQGPGLGLLLPFVAAFFAGGAWLSIALARAGVVSRANPWLHAVALAVAIAGGMLVRTTGVASGRSVGLAALALVAAAQAWLGLALRRAK